jgi:hypothetical protein
MQMIAPLPAYRYTAWEEMYLHTKEKIGKRKPFDPVNSGIIPNSKTAVQFYVKFPRYGIVLFLILFAATLYLKLRPIGLILPLSLFLLYTAGYLLFFINDRYLFFGACLLVVMLVFLANCCMIKKKWIRIPLSLLITYSLLRPAVDYYLLTDTSEEKTGMLLAKFSKSDTAKNIRYVSYYPYQFANIAYENKWQNYGGLAGYKYNRTQLLASLEKYKIRYIIVQDSIAHLLQLSPFYTKQNTVGVDGIQLWKRN